MAASQAVLILASFNDFSGQAVVEKLHVGQRNGLVRVSGAKSYISSYIVSSYIVSSQDRLVARGPDSGQISQHMSCCLIRGQTRFQKEVNAPHTQPVQWYDTVVCN